MVDHMKTSHSSAESNGSDKEQSNPKSKQGIPEFFSPEERKKNVFLYSLESGVLSEI